VKSESDILKRLKNLRVRYARRFISLSQERKPENCSFNFEHSSKGTYEDSNFMDIDRAPIKSVTLIVIKPEIPTRLCMYGSENPETWNGIICDRDEISKSCKYFIPKQNFTQAKENFLDILSDDEYVYENYKDIAALQWVLGDRIHKSGLSLFERFKFWIHSIKLRIYKPKLIPSSLNPWDEENDNT
jgi:hypothetical protein